MATVLMSGRPPPLKLYRQAASASVAMLAPTAPQRGREHDRRVHPNHREFKASRGLREIDAGLGRLRADGELRAAARHDLPLAPPLGLERSEEHTSELQSRSDLVCRLLLEKKKKIEHVVQQGISE